MDEKISLKAVDQYCEAYANKVVAPFFAQKDKISGPEILSLCEIKQVNLFVIRELMHAWRVESEKLKSPFFDYEAAAVAEALQNFQNTLSNHISIQKMDFLPLLRKAAGQTLFVVLAPYDFYAETLDRQGPGMIRVAELRSDIKYLKINKAPLERLAEKIEEKKTAVSGNEAFGMLDSILEEVNFTPEDIELYIAQFSKVVPLELENLYSAPEPELTMPAPKSSPVNIVVGPRTAPQPVAEKKTQEVKPVAVKSVPVTDSKSVLTNLQKISTIKENLTINQKFMFTKILFNGDFEIFSQTIDRLDSFDNLKQAMHFLQSDFGEWDKESDEYLEFMEMLEKRYS